MKYDYLIVGAGLFGATLAEFLTRYNKRILVVEQESHVGGMCYTETMHNITIHKYGAHIFRTSDITLWRYIDSISPLKPFINSPLSYVDGKLYNLPFNMNTFNELWGVTTPDDAKQKILHDRKEFKNPSNLEEYALSTVGKTIYEMFIKGYTEKQWNKPCKDLPASILGRIPLRFTFDNNYYQNKPYQGVPIHGYTDLIEKMLSKADVICNADWHEYVGLASKIIYTGSIDEYYDYCFGELNYRSLYFKEEVYNVENYQGVAVINYPCLNVPYTRQIEHKHFLNEISNVTVVSKEYPIPYTLGKTRYYPIETEDNLNLYHRYSELSDNVVFAGRLGQYKYTDMEQTVCNALNLGGKLL